jgi:hypothetical protein
MARSERFNTGRIHCRRPILIRTFNLQSDGGPYIAQRVCRRDPSLGDWTESAEGDHSLPGGRDRFDTHEPRGVEKEFCKRLAS